MWTCPRCRLIYAGETRLCGVDGAQLQELDEDPLIGRTIDRYRIIRRLGEGAMGCVYQAHHIRLTNRQCAIKILFGEMASNREVSARFRREAEAASSMNHENVVPVIDFGETPEGLTYLVMEYVEGRTLQSAIKAEAPFSVERAARITRQIAGGLAHAHSRGYVHRDLKPGNIVLAGQRGDERPRIVDFGIAGIFDQKLDATKLTKTNRIVGTPLYMAPEQATGSAADPRSDAYALGVILFQLLAGRPPFTGASGKSVLMEHIMDPPPRLPDCGGLEQLAYHLLEKAPSERLGAEQITAEIDRLAPRLEPAGGTGPTGTPHTADSSRPYLAALVFALGASLVVGAGSWFAGSTGAPVEASSISEVGEDPLPAAAPQGSARGRRETRPEARLLSEPAPAPEIVRTEPRNTELKTPEEHAVSAKRNRKRRRSETSQRAEAGRLSVSVLRGGKQHLAEIFVDGELVHESRWWSGKIRPGVHEIRVVSSDGVARTEKVEVEPGKTARAVIDLSSD